MLDSQKLVGSGSVQSVPVRWLRLCSSLNTKLADFMSMKNERVNILTTIYNLLTIVETFHKFHHFKSFQALEKLSICESDYFGLQYSNGRGEEQWLNLRNRLTDELPGSSPYKLILLVKFFVEQHSVVQETTRLVVYNLRLMVLWNVFCSLLFISLLRATILDFFYPLFHDDFVLNCYSVKTFAYQMN